MGERSIYFPQILYRGGGEVGGPVTNNDVKMLVVSPLLVTFDLPVQFL